MNIIAHGLWGAALAPKNTRNQKWFNQSIIFSVAPDFIWLIFLIPYLIITKNQIPTGWNYAPKWFFELYGLTHSIIIWLAVFIGSSFIFKKLQWPELFWLFHILLDIPGHTHFTTPFLFPISDFRYKGLFSWESPLLLLLSLLIPIVVLLLKYRVKLREKIKVL